MKAGTDNECVLHLVLLIGLQFICDVFLFKSIAI